MKSPHVHNYERRKLLKKLYSRERHKTKKSLFSGVSEMESITFLYLELTGKNLGIRAQLDHKTIKILPFDSNCGFTRIIIMVIIIIISLKNVVQAKDAKTDFLYFNYKTVSLSDHYELENSYLKIGN